MRSNTSNEGSTVSSQHDGGDARDLVITWFQCTEHAHTAHRNNMFTLADMHRQLYFHCVHPGYALHQIISSHMIRILPTFFTAVSILLHRVPSVYSVIIKTNTGGAASVPSRTFTLLVVLRIHSNLSVSLLTQETVI